MKYLALPILLILLTSCTKDIEPKKTYRKMDSLLEEDEIDEKFEFYEGGSLQSEKEIHQEIIDFSLQMLENNRSKYPKIPRDAHAKSHGCFKAKVVLDNKHLKEAHRFGIFKENKSYEAWLRFSNNDHLPQRKDDALDLRGMAIKLMGVTGPKVMSGYETEQTQDFLMYGSPVFFIANNKDYIPFIKGLRDENAVTALLTHTPRAALRTVTAQFKIRKKINPLEINFFSATPIRMGEASDPNRMAAKYAVSKCDDEVKIYNPSDKSAHNYMRDNLVETLKHNKKICWDFKLQMQTHPKVMPIEDATVEWLSKAPARGPFRNRYSPYVTVAKIYTSFEENEDVNSKESRDFCEDLSFSPWHTLSDHKPLGRTMRMRRDVYRAIADFRRQQNNADMAEPKP